MGVTFSSMYYLTYVQIKIQWNISWKYVCSWFFNNNHNTKIFHSREGIIFLKNWVFNPLPPLNIVWTLVLSIQKPNHYMISFHEMACGNYNHHIHHFNIPFQTDITLKLYVQGHMMVKSLYFLSSELSWISGIHNHAHKFTRTIKYSYFLPFPYLVLDWQKKNTTNLYVQMTLLLPKK